MASNILLLASKNLFTTSQGLVGAGMNCRALISIKKIIIETFTSICDLVLYFIGYQTWKGDTSVMKDPYLI